MEKVFRFYKNSRLEWFVDLPEWDKDPADLQMVEGADTFLDKVAGKNTECRLLMSDEPLQNAMRLVLIHKRDPDLKGGADYLLETYKDDVVNHKLWLCAVTETIFFALPEVIWFKVL